MARCPYENKGSRCTLETGHKDEADAGPIQHTFSTPSKVVHITEDGDTHILYPNKEKVNGQEQRSARS